MTWKWRNPSMLNTNNLVKKELRKNLAIYKKKNINIENYVAAVSRAYWIVLGLCVAAIVLSTGRDEAARYKQAANELRAISRLSAHVGDIYKEAGKILNISVAPKIVNIINALAENAQISIDKHAVVSSLEYFHVDQGHLDVSIKAAPSDLKEKVERFLRLPRYSVKIPKYNDKKFENVISSVMKRVTNKNHVVAGFEFSCNYADNQCRGEMKIRKDAGELFGREYFYVEAEDNIIPLYPYNVLGFPTEEAALKSMKTIALSQLEEDLIGKDLSASYSYLSAKINEKEGSIKVFDLSFSGLAAFYAVPVAVVAFLGWMLMHLRELASIDPPSKLMREQAVEFFYSRKSNSVIIIALITIMPVGSLLLIARMARESDTTSFMSAAVLSIIATLLSCYIVVLRYYLMNKNS